ncbi:MAG: hypothetical protein JWP87_4605 [Labilithrix sp.]|nr:hypothetical protein [Labilithrix sp.]
MSDSTFAVMALRASHGPVTVGLDEGGLRCTWRDGGAAYLPFDAVADATLGASVFGKTLLVITLATGGTISITLANGNPFDVLGAVVARLGERRTDEPVTHPAFERGDAELGAWLERVRRHASGGEAYREAPMDHGAIAALLDDDAAGAGLRAAAAHALLTAATDEDLATVAGALVTRALPPLVVVAAGLAAGGSALVDDGLLAEMSALLPSPDREAVATVAARTPERTSPDACERVASARQAATDAARRALEGDARAHAGEGGRRMLHPVSTGAGNGARWVGRSWGL